MILRRRRGTSEANDKASHFGIAIDEDATGDFRNARNPG
jgi:hypothetical protein